jgi:hypothetical protein
MHSLAALLWRRWWLGRDVGHLLHNGIPDKCLEISAYLVGVILIRSELYNTGRY